jgi:hypothetical protein
MPGASTGVAVAPAGTASALLKLSRGEPVLMLLEALLVVATGSDFLQPAMVSIVQHSRQITLSLFINLAPKKERSTLGVLRIEFITDSLPVHLRVGCS